MNGIYRVGQKVTPADHYQWVESPTRRRPDPRSMPQYGGEYTVAEFRLQHDGAPGLLLREFPEACFEVECFRPLVDESVRRSVSWTLPTPVDA